MELYTLSGPTTPAWGDYSDILISGMISDIGRKNGLFQLERTGPFMPPISFPGFDCVLVTDNLKKYLEGCELSGITFLPVTKKRVVFLEWEKWDQSADEPQEYPDSGEPEDYILQRPHSEETARQLGEIWEIHLEVHADFIPYQGLANWDGTDWFKVLGQETIFISEAAKQCLESHVSQWIEVKKAARA